MGKAVRRTLCLLACLTLAGLAAVCAPGLWERYTKEYNGQGIREEEAEAGGSAQKRTSGEAGGAGASGEAGGAGTSGEAGGAGASGEAGQADGGAGMSDGTGDSGENAQAGGAGDSGENAQAGGAGNPYGAVQSDDSGEHAAGDRTPGKPGSKEAAASSRAADGGETAGSSRAADGGETAGSSGKPDTTEDTTIIITGDVLFGNVFRVNYDRNGITGVVSEELLKELLDADILLINNEFPFSTRGTPMEEKQFTFRCDPAYAGALGEMGVDVVSLANNHTLDYGRDALTDTFAVLDGEGIRYAGAGESAERAGEVQVIEVNGKRIGILAATRVIPVASWNAELQTPGLFACYDDTRLNELVAEADCDFLIVYPHWGVEYEAYPEDYQTGIARRCLASGADVVVGCHTHCLQGAEWIDGKPVFYSLGNFVFGKDIDRSAVLKITLAADGTVRYQLLPVSAKSGVTSLAEGEKAAQILRYLDGISPGAQIGEDGLVTEQGGGSVRKVR